MIEINRKIYIRSLEIRNSLSKDWIYVGTGYSRKVYRRNNIVIKLPLTQKGIEDNLRERHLFINNRNIPYAPCRLINNYLLIMKAVEPLDQMADDNPKKHLISNWDQILWDGPQVGIDQFDRVYIYDYGDE